MAKKRVLIAVKTYPTLSRTHNELVCTAGFLEDGSWVRIYPVPFRFLKSDHQYDKWQWIEIDIEKNPKDRRAESFKPLDLESIKPLEKLDTANNWAKRKKYALNHVYYNLSELIAEAKDPEKCISLGVLKPKEIIRFKCEKVASEWDTEKLNKVKANLSQSLMFETDEEKYIRENFTIAQKIPYKFSYVFTTEDGIQRDLMIEDWEIGELYRNCMKKYKDENIACQKVKERYFDDFVKNKDVYFFMGTMLSEHFRSPSPFIIIGVFYPKKEVDKGPSLFDVDI